MLLARYFLYVGGALLTLLLIVSAELPQTPAVPGNAAADLPAIRINSDRRWPAKVVLDTSAPTVVPIRTTDNSDTADTVPPATAELAAKPAPREAFAQLAPSDLKNPAVKKSKPRTKRKIVRRRMYSPPIMVAQQPQFGFFGNRIW